MAGAWFLKFPFYIFLTVSYPHDPYCLKAKPELSGKRHIALFVLEFPIVKQRNGYLMYMCTYYP